MPRFAVQRGSTIPSMDSFLAATWNLDGYHAPGRLPRQLDLLTSLEADVLVLTEVLDSNRLPGMHFWWSEPGKLPYSPNERAVGVASRWGEGRQLPVTDGRLSCCIGFDAPGALGQVVIYGVVIPYKFDGVAQGAAVPWERHRQCVEDVLNDIYRLRADRSATRTSSWPATSTPTSTEPAGTGTRVRERG